MRPESEALRRMTRLRSNLLEDQPFFGVLAMKLSLVEDPRCKSMWTDAKHLGFNPSYLASLLDVEARGLIAQLILHISLGHPWRKGARDAKRWKKSGDYAINEVLKKSGFVLPVGSVFDAAYAGMPAELIYAKLLDEEEDAAPPPPKPSSEPTEPNSQDEPGSDGEGSGPGDTAFDESTDIPGELREAAEDAVEQDWQSSTVAAEQLQGSLPGALGRMAKLAQEPRVSWKDQLWHLIQSCQGGGDFTWTRPNRRWLHMRLYLPSSESVELGPAIFARDTSGSIAGSYIDQFNAEVSDVVSLLSPSQAFIVDCDAKVQAVQELEKGETPSSWDAKGGGGTSFEPVFSWVEEENIEPACVVYFTDLQGKFPSEAPDYPVFWVVPGATQDVQVPFGTVIPLKMD